MYQSSNLPYGEDMTDERTLEEIKTDLFWVDKYPLSAHTCLVVEGLLRDLLKYHTTVCENNLWPNHWVVGLTAAISYFETMGNFKAEQEHQDAFCTPIIEGS